MPMAQNRNAYSRGVTATLMILGQTQQNLLGLRGNGLALKTRQGKSQGTILLPYQKPPETKPEKNTLPMGTTTGGRAGATSASFLGHDL